MPSDAIPGLGPFHAQHLERIHAESRILARVARVDAARLLVATADGPREARVPKRLRADAPVVGDFVALSPPPGAGAHVVEEILPRRALLARKQPGASSAPQPLVANVDVALVLTSPDADFSARRTERYVALCAAGGVEPAIVISKSDLVPDVEPWLARARAAAPGARVMAMSAREGRGVEEARALLAGRTGVVLGSSGVGKSTLVNALLGEARQETRDVREADAKGRHATTSRELFEIPGGGALIDTPGLREVHLAGDAASAGAAFAEIEEAARACRFSDCRHGREPGCAVRAAIEAGAIAQERLESLRRLQDEARRADARRDAAASRAQARAWGRMARETMRAKRERRE